MQEPREVLLRSNPTLRANARTVDRTLANWEATRKRMQGVQYRERNPKGARVNNDGQPHCVIPHMPPARVQAGAAAVASRAGRLWRALMLRRGAARTRPW